ncbi:hypothetical protein [Zoogloea sp. LCSB751]|uniref:hypothetical protein n=1 Tax=Zoogloea sp. LCSB751 TaxID=1965277 RepID=UPI0011166547|nr:hypothetical protein [Zoogloea sp. LCSB751]
MAHYVHYLPRKVVEPDYADRSAQWFAENQPDDQGFEVPSYHVTRSTSGPATRVAIGDTIWLFSQLVTPWGSFPAALDAKISVCDVIPYHRADEQPARTFRYQAGQGSRWFPLRDATACIKQLHTRSLSGIVRPILSHPSQPIGQALQSMRELEDADPLLAWAEELSTAAFDLISYRLIDGTPRACKKAMELVHDRQAIFWDRWSLPRRLAERREFLSDAALDAHIMGEIHRCRKVWGIHSARYAEVDSYSAREMAEARRLNKLQLY